MALDSDPAQSETIARNGTNTPDATANKKPPVVCVFCGASPGTSPSHLEAARALARAMHEAGIHLVYGGGTTGVMGEIAKTLVSLSGPESVHGVIPRALLEFERDAEHKDANVIDEKIYGRTTVVKDMHTRKQLMAREVIESGVGGGFVALSGGYGTMEELMEVVTWNQLGIHARGVVIYNVEGYYDGLLSWVRNAVQSGFVSEGNRGIMVEARTGEEVVAKLTGYKTAEGRFKLKWGEN
ncbi:Bifunctional cytokinin biosynthesis protein [Fulvia fulva]|uniref:Bifunctional cytokinin biosynthesis protein n=1 Tax=Passalora fulva TaxID=5499 RepID=A0A9Q8LAB3_PASFU|nr:Bifunctional cytokinin biosynthesis protein [Fulvia fulva]KAK4633041.1 Bifunctional cytokinin biosynthesis protein [Fulvia fulva]UJO13599.1 Bifunctional cytokinin biosynthesis protein [Fulvia fulva]WPV11742.1 Bifunctional cytokinin biosynthesis protein [Fulvia fulva]